jgi:hypothetical protein
MRTSSAAVCEISSFLILGQRKHHTAAPSFVGIDNVDDPSINLAMAVVLGFPRAVNSFDCSTSRKPSVVGRRCHTRGLFTAFHGGAIVGGLLLRRRSALATTTKAMADARIHAAL